MKEKSEENTGFFLTRIKIGFLAIVLVAVGLGSLTFGLRNNQSTAEKIPVITTIAVEGEQTQVLRVVDGDTIEIAGGQKVRYIGIDTPETVDPRRPVACFGKEASLENKRLVESKKVRLERDVSETDKFGRLLRYVYLTRDQEEIMVNEYLIRQGFAKVSTYPPDVKYADRFLNAEREAREENRGLWQECIMNK